MDLIDELLERDAGTVNSTIIGKPLDSFGKNSKAMKKKKVICLNASIKYLQNRCIHAVRTVEFNSLYLKWPRKPKKVSLTCLFFFISGT